MTKISNLLTDEAALAELGQRLKQRRIELNLTQAELANKAGIAKPTVENIERGAAGQMSIIVRVLRALNLMNNLNRLVPEPLVKPIDLLDQRQPVRKRARKKKSKINTPTKPWAWKEDG